MNTKDLIFALLGFGLPFHPYFLCPLPSILKSKCLRYQWYQLCIGSKFYFLMSAQVSFASSPETELSLKSLNRFSKVYGTHSQYELNRNLLQGVRAEYHCQGEVW